MLYFVLAIVVGVSFVLALSRRSILLVCFFYFTFGFLTTVNEDTIPLLGGFKLYRLAYPFLFGSVLVRLIRDPALCGRFRRWPLLSYLGLLGILIASSFYSSYVNVLAPSDQFSLVNYMIVILLFFVSASHVQRQSDLLALALTTALLSFSISAWVIWTAAQGDFALWRGGTNVNENYESLYVLVGAIALVQLGLLSKRFLAKAACCAALSVIVFACLILASRGMLIAFAVAIVVSTAEALWQLPRAKLLGTAILVVVLVSGMLLLPGANNIVGAFQGADITTLDERTLVWSYAWKHFSTASGFRMLFGEGLSSSITVLGSAFPYLLNYHNMYLMWLMEQGILGLVVFMFFLYRVAFALVKTNHPYRNLLRGWYAYLLVAGLSSTASNEHVFWILLGAIVGAVSQGGLRSVANRNELRPHRQLLPQVGAV